MVVAVGHHHLQNQHHISDASPNPNQHVLCTAPHAMCLVTRVVGADTIISNPHGDANNDSTSTSTLNAPTIAPAMVVVIVLVPTPSPSLVI